MERNASFALEDLIRVRSIALPEALKNYQAMIGGPNDLYYLKREGSGIPGSSWDNRLIPAWYYEPVEVLEGGEVIMDIVTGDGRRPVLPGLVLSRYGKGKVLYSSSSLESLYYSNGNTVIRGLIAEMISAVSPAPAPYSIEAPAGLITNLTQSGNKYLLQMTNWTGNKFEKKHVIEDYGSEVRKIVVRLPLPQGKNTGSVKSITGSDFTMQTRENILEISMPEAGAYEGIEITLN